MDRFVVSFVTAPPPPKVYTIHTLSFVPHLRLTYSAWHSWKGVNWSSRFRQLSVR